MRPFRATNVTEPEIFPASMCRCINSRILSKRCAEIPTSSGLARGVSAADVVMTSVKKRRNIDVDFTIKRIFSPCCRRGLPETDAADHLLKNRLIRWEFILWRDEHHIKQSLVVQARHNPSHFSLTAPVGSADHHRPQTRFVADQQLRLRAGYDAEPRFTFPINEARIGR